MKNIRLFRLVGNMIIANIFLLSINACDNGLTENEPLPLQEEDEEPTSIPDYFPLHLGDYKVFNRKEFKKIEQE